LIREFMRSSVAWMPRSKSFGNVPSVAVKAEVNGKELDAKVLGDGTVQPTPVVNVIRQDDGAVKEIRYEHRAKPST